MAASDRMMRALVVGSGWARHPALALANNARVQIVGLVARGSERSIALAARVGVRLFRSLDSALDATAPSLAVVAVGQEAHPVIAESLLLKGCHLLCAHPVATGAAEVWRLSKLARAKHLIAWTDYSLRMSPRLAAAATACTAMGGPLRIDLRCPSRALVIGVDLVVAVAGEVRAVVASSAYPESLTARRRAAPSSFAPSVLLEHAGGCVSTLVPVPHADLGEAHRMEISTPNGRIDLALPSGAVMEVKRLGDRAERRLLHQSSADSTDEIFAAPMRLLTKRFVEATAGDAVNGPTLEREAHIRAVWQAIERASQSGARERVAGEGEWD